MHRFTSFSFLVLFLAGMVMLGTGAGCANIIPPTGGPKDSLPPRLVMALPKDSMLNFNAKKITLTFDEYVQLDNNLGNSLIVSPYPENPPVIESKLRNVTVVLRDSLKPNTTYSINFGSGIKDVNEGNVAKRLTYVFSTGDHLDNGTLSGKVILAETGKKDTTLLVLLHKNLDDTSIRKNNPVYMERLDSGGNFKFSYIAPGTYNVFVLPNEYSKKYDDSTKIFAFLNTPVTIDSNGATQPVKLYAYREVKPTDKKPGSAQSPGKKPAPKGPPPPLKLSTSLSNGPQDLLTPMVFTVSEKMAKFDSGKIVLTDTGYKPLGGVHFSADTTLKDYSLYYKWEENTPYKIVIQKDAFTDSLGATLAKNDTITFKTRRETEYGSIRLHFNNINLAKNPVLLLMQGDKIFQSVPLTSNEWYQQLFKPGDYEIRILYDDNKNGIWDAGNYKLKLQPEVVTVYPRKLVIKANIDNEVDINL